MLCGQASSIRCTGELAESASSHPQYFSSLATLQSPAPLSLPQPQSRCLRLSPPPVFSAQGGALSLRRRPPLTAATQPPPSSPPRDGREAVKALPAPTPEPPKQNLTLEYQLL